MTLFSQSVYAKKQSRYSEPSSFGVSIGLTPGLNLLTGSPSTSGAQVGLGVVLEPFYKLSETQLLKLSLNYHKFSLKSELPGTVYELSSQLLGVFVIFDLSIPGEKFDWLIGAGIGFTMQSSPTSTTTNSTLGTSVRSYESSSALGWTVEGGVALHWTPTLFSPILFKATYWGVRLGDGYPLTLGVLAGLGLYF